MAKRKYGDGSVFQRHDGRWEGRLVVGYKENGYAKTKSVTAKTKAECEERLKQLREEHGRRSEKIKPDMPFGSWAWRSSDTRSPSNRQMACPALACRWFCPISP